MTRVDVDFETRRAPVPLEIYDEDLVLVERRLSSEPTTLEPGAYFAVSRTPAGRAMQVRFQVGKNTSTTVTLGVVSDGDDAYFELVPPRGLARPLAWLVRRFREPALRAYERLPDGQWRPAGRVRPGESLESRAWSVRVAWCAVGLERRDAPALFVRAPAPALPYLSFRACRDGDGPADLDANLRHPAARALLSYMDAGQIGFASVLATSGDLSPEALLQDKLADPIAAAAGAYVLLQLGDLDRLHDWTTNLRDWFEWLPDGLVVHAEHLARLGRHDDALSDLRRLPARGIPCLSVGLGMATDRLRAYARRWPEDKELRGALEELTRYSLATDFSKPVTTFAGQAPDLPGVPPPAPPSLLARLARGATPDVRERPDGSTVFRMRLPKVFRRPAGTTTTQRSSAMAATTVDTPAAAAPKAPADTGQDAAPTVVRISFAVVLTAVFLVAAYLLYRKTGTKDSQEWERLVYVFGAIEAVAFTAIGWIFGREVNRQRAESAEQRADDAEQQKAAEKEKGAKLAGLVVGEGAKGGASPLQPHGAGGGGGAATSAVEYARRHYGM